jgi:hypothetical protein
MKPETITVRLDEYADHMHTVSSLGIHATAMDHPFAKDCRKGWIKDQWSDWYYPANLIVRLRPDGRLDA